MTGTRLRLVIAGLAVLALVTGGLVVAALSRDPETPRAQAPASRSASPSPSRSASAAPSPSGSSRRTALAPLAQATTLVEAVDGNTAWLGGVGSCDGEPTSVRVTTDRGATFRPISTEQLGQKRVLSLQVQSDALTEAVFRSGPDCELQGARSFTGGRFWATSDQAARNVSYLDPDDSFRISQQGQTVPPPCKAPVQLADAGASAIVLCADRSAWRGASGRWARLAVTGATAVGADGESAVIAAAEGGDCAGLNILVYPADPAASADPSTRGCVTDATATADTAVDIVGDGVWLVQNGRIRVSEDRGRTW